MTKGPPKFPEQGKMLNKEGIALSLSTPSAIAC